MRASCFSYFCSSLFVVAPLYVWSRLVFAWCYLLFTVLCVIIVTVGCANGHLSGP